jgi:WD40 repeat protein
VPRTGRIRLDAATYDINDLLLDAKAHRAFVASSAGWVRSYDLQSHQMQSEWRMGSGATALAMSSDRQYLLIGTETGVICLRRLSDGAQLQCMAAHQGRVSSLVVAGDTFASATWQGEVALWGLPALQALSTLDTRGSVADLAFSADGSRLAVARNQRAPIRTEAINDAEKKSSKPDPIGVHLIEIYGHTDAGFTDKPTHTLAGHHSIISSLTWIGGDLLSGSWDRSVQLWNVGAGSRSGVLGNFKHIIRDLAASEEGANFAVASWGPENEDPALSWCHLRY